MLKIDSKCSNMKRMDCFEAKINSLPLTGPVS